MEKRLGRAMVGGLAAALLLTAGWATTAFAAEKVTTMATTAPLNLRDSSSMDGAVVDVMPKGTSVPVYGMTTDGWYHVEYDGKEGFCYYRYLNFEGTEDGDVHDGKKTVMYATAPLNVREKPSTDSRILGSLKVDEGVDVVSKHDGWFKVSFKGKDAYCFGEYLGFGQGGYAAEANTAGKNTMNQLVATAPLNVRTAPGTDARIIGSFAAGETVSVLAVEGDWYKVKYGDAVGYSHADYLK